MFLSHKLKPTFCGGEAAGMGQPVLVAWGTVELQLGAVQCSTVQYSTMQYSEIQHSAVQYSTLLYNTV